MLHKWTALGLLHSDFWKTRITSEVIGMRKLVSLEILLVEHSLERVRREKDSVIDKAWVEKGCLDSMQVSLNAYIKRCEEMCKTPPMSRTVLYWELKAL